MTKSLNKGVLLPGFVGPQERAKIPTKSIAPLTPIRRDLSGMNFIKFLL
jgi:hypothetical protein